MSTRLRAILVDDERLARQRLAEMLSESHAQDVEIVAEAEAVPQAANLCRELRPDVVFLDVQMFPENGFSLLPHLQEINPPPSIIFVTAFDTYAVNAFEVNALDYLLKPIKAERLQTSIRRLQSYHKQSQLSPTTAQSPDPVQERVPPPNLPKYEPEDFVALKDGRTLLIVKTHEIRVVQAQGSYSMILITDDRKIMVKTSISKWQEALPPSLFHKISRSLLVNTQAVASVQVHHRDQVQVLFQGLSTPLILSRLESQRLRTHS